MRAGLYLSVSRVFFLFFLVLLALCSFFMRDFCFISGRHSLSRLPFMFARFLLRCCFAPYTLETLSCVFFFLRFLLWRCLRLLRFYFLLSPSRGFASRSDSVRRVRAPLFFCLSRSCIPFRFLFVPVPRSRSVNQLGRSCVASFLFIFLLWHFVFTPFYLSREECSGRREPCGKSTYKGPFSRVLVSLPKRLNHGSS